MEHEVGRHSEDGVKKRYRRLGLSGGRGNRIKDELIDDGWLEAEVIPSGRTRKVMLRLTPKARAALGDVSATGSRESIAHEYWKRFYARKFEREGYRVQIEAPLGDGRVDVLATRGQERIAIEIETGKSDVIANVRRALRARVDKVLVVATNEKAMKKVERDLATGGLLLKGRVDVVLRDRSAKRSEP